MSMLDCHIHMESPTGSAQGLLERLAQAGLDGGVVFSQPPLEAVLSGSADFETRLAAVLSMTQGHRDRLFPFLWVHPREADACRLVELAAARGIAGFKMICDSYYPDEDDCLRLADTMARLGLPVIFHSGILWDGGVTSKYNRPLYFEALIQIPRLRFALAHCAWPWYDECIALYGKFLNTMAGRADGAEMFFDLTPGTPRIYRRDLMEKLFGVGYDVEHNILFGTDCNVEDYNVAWTRSWRETDDALYDDLAVSPATRRRIYGENLLRFLGRDQRDIVHRIPQTGLL